MPAFAMNVAVTAALAGGLAAKSAAAPSARPASSRRAVPPTALLRFAFIVLTPSSAVCWSRESRRRRTRADGARRSFHVRLSTLARVGSAPYALGERKLGAEQRAPADGAQHVYPAAGSLDAVGEAAQSCPAVERRTACPVVCDHDLERIARVPQLDLNSLRHGMLG